MGSRRYQRPWATQRGLDQVQEHVDLSAVPAGDVDFATRFAVTTSVPLVLDSVEVALVRYAGTDPLHVQLVNEGPRDNPFFPVQPNTDSPVAQWTTEAPGTSPGHPALFKLASQTGAVLQPGARLLDRRHTRPHSIKPGRLVFVCSVSARHRGRAAGLRNPAVSGRGMDPGGGNQRRRACDARDGSRSMSFLELFASAPSMTRLLRRTRASDRAGQPSS